jgi:serine/threonine protein kinase
MPETISEELKDFLTRCFEKDPFKRIDAKSLLQHPWLTKYDKSLFQKILMLSAQPEKIVQQ